MPYAPNTISVASRAIVVWSVKRKSIKRSFQSQSLSLSSFFFSPSPPTCIHMKQKTLKRRRRKLTGSLQLYHQILLTGTRGNPGIVGFDEFSFSKILYWFVLEECLLVGEELNRTELITLQEFFNWVVWEEVFTQDSFVKLKFSKKLNLSLLLNPWRVCILYWTLESLLGILGIWKC